MPIRRSAATIALTNWIWVRCERGFTMTDKHNPQLRDAVRLGDLFKVLAQLIAHKDKLDLTRIEIPENPWDFESAITRWVRSGECPPDVSETTAAASATLLSHEGAPAQLEILDQPEYGGDRLNIIVQPNEGGPFSVVSALGIHQAWRTLAAAADSGILPYHPLSILVRAWLAQQLPKTVTPFVPANRASLPRLHLIEAEATRLPHIPQLLRFQVNRQRLSSKFRLICPAPIADHRQRGQ